MKFHSISLRNVRAVEHLELNDIPDTGVILLHGDNEAGKSTVLDAIDVVLNFKHSTSDSRVKVLAPAGKDVGPDISLRATVGQRAQGVPAQEALGADHYRIET